MAVTSIPKTGAAPNWYCTRCELAFLDTANDQPCPRCQLDDALVERAAKPAPQKQAALHKPTAAPRGGLLGFGALVIGIPLWLEGARTTRDGWVLFLNWVGARLGIPQAIPASALWPWWLAIGALVLLGYAYSHIEVKQTPLSIRPWRVTKVWQVWVVWVVFIVSDVGTMYLGARSPRPTDPAILHQIAATGLSAAVYAILITFVPERLVMYGWHRLRG